MQSRFRSTASLMASTALFGLLASAPAHAETKVFEADGNHTILGFTAATLLFDVVGHFDKYKATISGDPDSLAGASVRIEIDTASVNTDNKKRDEHLRTADFFDAAKNKTITFTSTAVKKGADANHIVVDGTLDMHGAKKQLSIPFEVVVAKNGADFLEHVYKAELTLSRKDFGIGADSVAAKISLKDEVKLKLLLAGFFEAKKK